MAGLSEERLAPSNGIELAYQEVGDPAAEPVLLIMGLGTQMLGWDEELCAQLAERGFRVVRFDNRDIGHSTMLDAVGVPSRTAHVVGASMGGMIAQALAIEHPERVRSLVSMMSTTGGRTVGTPTPRAFGLMLAKAPRGREAYAERIVKTFELVGSPAYETDQERLRELAGRMYDRSHNPRGILRQMHAITASGDRTAALRKLSLPATVLHGTRDPLVRPSGGRATARAIPGARLRIVEGMGHDLPRELWPLFIDEIADTAARGGWRAPARQATQAA